MRWNDNRMYNRLSPRARQESKRRTRTDSTADRLQKRATVYFLRHRKGPHINN